MKSTIYHTLLLSSLVLRTTTAQGACADLESRISYGDVFLSGKCECTQGDNTLTLTCTRNNICLESGGESFSGKKATSSVTLEGVDSPSYSQKFISEVCFQYDNLYDGAIACHRSNSDGLGTQLDCIIQVDGQSCTDCQFCAIRDVNYNLLSGFDCSNVGGESARECTSDNTGAEGTIMRFLSSPTDSNACSGGSNNGSGSNNNNPSSPASPGPTNSPTSIGGSSSAFRVPVLFILEGLVLFAGAWIL